MIKILSPDMMHFQNTSSILEELFWEILFFRIHYNNLPRRRKLLFHGREQGTELLLRFIGRNQNIKYRGVFLLFYLFFMQFILLKLSHSAFRHALSSIFSRFISGRMQSHRCKMLSLHGEMLSFNTF